MTPWLVARITNWLKPKPVMMTRPDKTVALLRKMTVLSPENPRSRAGRGCPDREIFRKHYRCLRNKRQSKPYEFIGFGAMDVTKPYKFIGFGDIHGPKPYKFIGFRWAFISQTPVLSIGGFGVVWQSTIPLRTATFPIDICVK